VLYLSQVRRCSTLLFVVGVAGVIFGAACIYLVYVKKKKKKKHEEEKREKKKKSCLCKFFHSHF
jgi:uncharacterized membrane protein YciS (DUF1049 family)